MTATPPADPTPADPADPTPTDPAGPDRLPHHVQLRLHLAAALPVLSPATLAATAGLLPWPALPAITAALVVRACLLTP
ncbi:hypothetical protein ACIRST_22745 [Kitasatospora sp. NPDC101447]|uniref:hypothetical protein n=1 Tax=Kitasatospora sp. NPDC101447 TaxID=3364102 RepID=UPI0038009EEC